MTPRARALLNALRPAGGCWDRYNRVVAEGDAHHKETVLACFRKGWLSCDGNRVSLTGKGLTAALADQAEAPQ